MTRPDSSPAWKTPTHHHSLEPFKDFLEQTLHKDDHFSIPGLRLRARDHGFKENDLNRLTEALIWNRQYYDFPKDGDGIELLDRKSLVAWSGSRWMGLFPQRVQPPQRQAPSFWGRFLRGLA